MATSRIAIGTQVLSSKLGQGVITSIITKSTGYVEVTYSNGTVKKEMAFNLTDIDGISLKNKPAVKMHTEESIAKHNASVDAFQRMKKFAELNETYTSREVTRRMNNF